MRAVLLFALVFAVSALSPINHDAREQFVQFQQKYNKQYPTQAEFEHRFRVFQQNLIRNEELSRANPRATFGVNQFADLSTEEFAQQYLMTVDRSQFQKPAPLDFSIPRPENVRQCNPDPNNFNWGDCGATTAIYNQGQCGSCWAFSATETIESYFFLQGGALTMLSMEQIVDCDTTDDGCQGGLPSNAYQYVENAGGIEPYSDYPYTAEDGQSGNCNFSSSEVVATVTGYSSVSGEGQIYQQLSSSSGGPVSVCVDASTCSSYTGGVMTSCPNDIDHCVQAVGYANYGGSNAYWIVRNSWGTSWGENGFIFIAIGQDLCAIGDEATVVTATSA